MSCAGTLTPLGYRTFNFGAISNYNKIYPNSKIKFKSYCCNWNYNFIKPCSCARGLECLWLLYKMTKLEKTKKKPTKTIAAGFFKMFSPSRNVHESLLALILVNFEIKCFWPHGFVMKSKRRSDTLTFFSKISKRKLKNNQLIN